MREHCYLRRVSANGATQAEVLCMEMFAGCFMVSMNINMEALTVLLQWDSEHRGDFCSW